MLNISLAPTAGAFYSVTAHVDGNLVVLALSGGSGQWSGPGQNIHIAAVGKAGATFSCSVTGTKTDGSSINHQTTHTLDSSEHYGEDL
jgi:hypothetical protein